MPEPDVAAHGLRPYPGTAALLRGVVPRAGAAAAATHALSLLMVAPELEPALAPTGLLARALGLSREGNARDYTRRIAHGVADFLVEAAPDAGAIHLAVGDALDREVVAVCRERGLAVREERALPSAAEVSVAELVRASADAMRQGFYETSLEAAGRALARIDGRHADFGALQRNAVFSLLMLGRFDEAEARCAALESQSDDPALRSHLAYARAILGARLLPPGRRDYDAARRAIGEAVAWCERLEPSPTRTVNLVFLRNTLALVAMRSGDHVGALTLLDEGIARLRAEAPARYAEESVILWHNRARLHAAAGDPAAAVEDLGELLALEPVNSEAHLDRARLLHAAGRPAEALAHFDEAVAWSPPYPEPHFGRAVVLAQLGRSDEALAALARTIVLDPAHVGARINRAGLLFERGRHRDARADVDRALAVAPGSAMAFTLHGLLEEAAGRVADALAAYDRALALDPSEGAARANRARLAGG